MALNPMDATPGLDATKDRKAALQVERALVAPFVGAFELRIVLTFLAFAAVYVTVLVLGMNGVLPLWLGLLLNTAIASTFYMPLHEAAHGNISGRQAKYRRLEHLIGSLCAIPTGISYAAHKPSHMRHHAFTNDPDRDPDYYTAGSLIGLVPKWFTVVILQSFLPIFAFIPVTRKLLPATIQRSLAADGDRSGGLAQLRYWVISLLVLVVAGLLGMFWPVFLLWYVPSRIQALWLLTVFAWFPHHPAKSTGRYVDTRIAVFPLSGLLIRGHDHHAVHHLFPHVPHYHLREVWQAGAEDLVAKGVRSEGTALAATGPVIW
jgi:beta-carotene hydroxylase